MEKEKKKKSVFAKILIGIFSFIMSIVVLIGGAAAFVYFKYNINVVNLVKEINLLGKPVDENQIASYKYSNQDLENANKIINSVTTSTEFLSLTDKELGAYINNNIQENADGVKITLGSNEVNLLDYEFKLIQMQFTQPEDANDLTNFNIVLSANLEKLKNDYFSKFPASIIKNLIPTNVYISCTTTITKTSSSFDLESKKFTINNLSYDETKDLFSAINSFIKLGSADEFNLNLSKSFVDALIGENGIYKQLESQGATAYHFNNTESEHSFTISFVKHSITYVNTKNATNSNPTTYSFPGAVINLENISVNGYNFLGWFTESDGGEKISKLNTESFEDITVYAHWEIITYSINYNLNGGSLLIDNPTTYTIESSTIILNNPIKIISGIPCEFLGWTGTGLSSASTSVIIPTGSYGDRTYSARYEGDTRTITVNVDGSTLKTYPITLGEKIDESSILNEGDTLAGYTVKTWFEDDGFATEFNFDTEILEDTTIYGELEYVTNRIYFYPYIEKFDAVKNASSTQIVNINSFDELKGFIDYVRFFNVTNQNLRLNLNYSYSGSVSNQINSAYNEIAHGINSYQEGTKTKYTTEYFQITSTAITDTVVSGMKTYGLFYIDSENNSWNTDGTLTMVSTDEEKLEYLYNQQDYALKFTDPNLRDSTFNDFKIYSVSKSITVEKSEQLVWALENGYSVTATAGSPAETILNKAKEVLKTIITDDMTDSIKIQRIYEWLILNVNYDQKALAASEEATTSEQIRELKKYNSWYAEGVFLNKIAVCEGYAKSLLIMARLEGIPCVIVTGNNHAWNRVLVNGNWFVVDATHGDVGIYSSKQEIVSYAQFLITDNEKTSLGQTSKDYAMFAATTQFNYFEDSTYDASGYDLQINSQAELTHLCIVAKNFTPTISSEKYSFQFEIEEENLDKTNVWINNALSSAGYIGNYSVASTSKSNGNELITIILAA
ncbi:MAG: InlB B-repeat-containing protein [Clostridia bacterium]|nr:InlB B-repeat-containing protein [Clostridia bacterium]